MHRPTLSRAQWRTSTWSRSTTRTGALKNWLPGHRTSRNRTRSRSRLSGWRGGPDRRLVDRTRSCMRDDHARGRHLRTRRGNWSRWFCCYRNCWLWRCGGRRRHGTRSRCLGHRRRCNRRSNRACRNRHRLLCRSRSWRLNNWRRWSGKCRPDSRLRNDDPWCWRRDRSGRRRRRFHSRNRRRGRRRSCGHWTNRRSSGSRRSLLLTDGIQNVAWPGNIG